MFLPLRTQPAFDVRHAIEEAVLEIGERAGKRSGEMANHRIELGGCPNADCNGSMASLSGKKMGRRSAPRATEEKARPNLRLLGLLHSFAVETDIETFALLFFGDAQADDHVDDLEDHEATDAAIHQRRGDRAKLHQDVGIGATDV